MIALSVFFLILACLVFAAYEGAWGFNPRSIDEHDHMWSNLKAHKACEMLQRYGLIKPGTFYEWKSDIAEQERDLMISDEIHRHEENRETRHAWLSIGLLFVVLSLVFYTIGAIL